MGDTHTLPPTPPPPHTQVVPLVDPLIRSLLSEQPADPAAFCQAYFQAALGPPPPATSSPAADVLPAGSAEVAALHARIAELEAENLLLQTRQGGPGKVAGWAVPRAALTPHTFVVNWNLAGVNTNAVRLMSIACVGVPGGRKAPPTPPPPQCMLSRCLCVSRLLPSVSLFLSLPRLLSLSLPLHQPP